MSKKSIFGQNYLKFDGCHGNFKNDRHTNGMSKFPQRMNEQVRKVSAPSSKLVFQKFENILWGEASPPPTLLYVRGLK